MANIEKLKFLEIFSEDEKETLRLLVKIRVRGQDFNVGDAFRKSEKIAEVDFHVFRYFDFAVKPLDNDVYEIVGVFPQK